MEDVLQLHHQREQRGISGSTLKLIAIITMLLDHIGAAVLQPYIMQTGEWIGIKGISSLFNSTYWERAGSLLVVYWILRAIGRIAFPIFCFLLVEGFYHTKDKMKYALRLFCFALLSEVPFDLAFSHTWLEFQHQNVFFTLLLGLCALIIIDRFRANLIVVALSGFVAVYLAQVARTDYSSFGVVFIILLYYLRNQKMLRNIVCAVAMTWEITAPLAFLPIHFYNGKRGLSLKYLFYAFYPVHLIILYGISVGILR